MKRLKNFWIITLAPLLYVLGVGLCFAVFWCLYKDDDFLEGDA